MNALHVFDMDGTLLKDGTLLRATTARLEISRRLDHLDELTDLDPALIADLTARGETSMLTTMSPDFFARHLHDHGIEVVHASRFPPLPFDGPIDPDAILTPADKVRLTDAERTVEALARVAYRGEDLHEAYAHGRDLLDQTSPR